MRRHSRALWFATAAAIVTAVPHSGLVAQSSSGSPVRPPLAPLSVRLGQCVVGGAEPAIFVEFWVTGGIDLTGITVAGLVLQASPSRFVPANQGPITVREYGGLTDAGAFDVRPFNGIVAARATVHLQAFAALSMAAFGADAGYPDRELAVGLQVRAAGNYIATSRGGRCRVGPAG